MLEERNEAPTSRKKNGLSKAFQRWLIPFVAFGFIIIHMIWPGLVIDAITLGLLLIAILPWLSTLIEEATLPGGWGLTFRRRIDAVQEEQKVQRGQIEAINLLLDRLITPYELEHLRCIRDGEKYEVEDSKKTRTFLLGDLRHLASLGFITREPHITIQELGDRLQADGRADIKKYVSITDVGRDYLALLGTYKTERREE